VQINVGDEGGFEPVPVAAQRLEVSSGLSRLCTGLSLLRRLQML
jgi:hypothetical protein